MQQRPVQMQIPLPYRHQPAEHPKVRRLLDAGWEITQLQRVTDKEALITLRPRAAAEG